MGIREALTQAGRIRQIAASNPMDRVAILRFLLALLYWCKGNPPADTHATSGDSFPAEWFAKLDQHKEYFNLLGNGKRFYQYRRDDDKPLTANYLIHEIPTGTNSRHFRHATDEVDGLCLACCAMGLLRLPLFSTSGGRGKPPGVNAKPPLYVIPVGGSLAETLRLSWRLAASLGTPAWEKPDIQLPKTGEVALLTGLTWLPRRVWLGDPAEANNACISCGAKERLVRLCVFAGLGSTRTDESGLGRIWRDPHVVYTTSAKGEVTSLHASDVLGSSDAAAGQRTRIMGQILASGLAGTGTSTVWVVGFSTVQSNKYLECMEFFVSLACSPNQTKSVVDRIVRWRKETWALARNAQPPNEKRSSRKHPEIQSLIAAVRPQVEGKVSAEVGDLLTGGDAAWEEAASKYRPMMEVVARSLTPGFTTAAVERRRQIANALPDMTPTGPAKKATRKKGGAK
jgi:hypothetical protein